MDTQPMFRNEGPFSYANWKAMQAGLQSNGATEYTLHTDAHITADIEEGCGPYQLINQVPISEIAGLRPAICLRMEYHLPDEIPSKSMWKTDNSRYHGGTLIDEIAALVSLCLGIRLKAGPCTRWFKRGEDGRGRPIAWFFDTMPTLPQSNGKRILPLAVGTHSLLDAQPLQTLTKLTPTAAVALVRAARLYQDALWIGETEPELAWLMLVSAVEVAAGHWRSSQDSPLERMRASMPDLVAILEPCGAELVDQVAGEIAPVLGSTLKFKDFLLTFLPAPPSVRPEAYCQHPWTDKEFKKSFGRIYDYRSKALHGGTPFPSPMCEPPPGESVGAFAERPLGLATKTKGSVWSQKDTPMLLYLFEYIVRNALLNWWRKMIEEESQ